MRKTILVAVAAVVAMAATLPLAASWKAHAGPQCPGWYGVSLYNINECVPLEVMVAQHCSDPRIAQYACPNDRAMCRLPSNVAHFGNPDCHDTGQTQAPTSTPAARTPSSGAPPPVSKPAVAPPPKPARVVPPPRGFDAPPQAVSAAKNAPATPVDPAKPPKPLAQADFHQQIKSAVTAHPNNVQVVTVNNQALVRPRHWDYLDYDTYHRPTLYNPITEAMTFRYFYAGAYQEVSVPAGGRIVLNAAITGLFPFTAVSDSYVASGSFTGGAWIPPDGWSGPPAPSYTPPAPPTLYRNVSAYVPADNQTVQVGQVEVVGHDGSQPTGSQDTFMIDDSTLAWGQVTDPSNGGQVTVTKTQSLPGIGPTDDGGILLALAQNPQPARNWTPWVLGGLAVIAAALIVWMVMRRKRTEEVKNHRVAIDTAPDDG